MKYILLLLASLLFTSCATIFNSRYCTTNFRTKVPTTAVIDSDTIELRSNGVNIVTFKRSKEPKEIVLIKDTAIDTVLLKPKSSDAYTLNLATMGLGFLIDINTPKKWMYPQTVYLTDKWIRKNDISNVYRHDKYAHKGAVNLRVSFPYANLFYSAYEANNEGRLDGGFMGFSIGVDYFYNKKTFLNLSGSVIMDVMFPFPAPVYIFGERNHMASAYGSISNNHMLAKNRLSVGYGLSFGHDVWNTVDHGDYDVAPGKVQEEYNDINRSSNSLGLVFPFYYYTKRSFYMGVVYRPMFLQFKDKTRFTYQYTMSFDFGWRIRLSK